MKSTIEYVLKPIYFKPIIIFKGSSIAYIINLYLSIEIIKQIQKLNIIATTRNVYIHSVVNTDAEHMLLPCIRLYFVEILTFFFNTKT